MPKQSRQENLNFFLEAVRRVAGQAAIDPVLTACQGMEVWVSQIPRTDHWLVQAVGIEKAEAICKEMTVFDADGRCIGFRFYVPFMRNRKAIEIYKAKLFDEVRSLLGEGLSVPAITRRTACSERTVRRLRGTRKDAGQIIDDPFLALARTWC